MKEIKTTNLTYYQCEECGFFYTDKEKSAECEKWCAQNKSCNIEIAKDAVKVEIAIFAAGCFWGVEDKFRGTKGVISAVSGYSGGHTENPTYEEVCSGKTGHAESVKIIFDTYMISYKELLEIFWNLHDPTQVNRQGPDVGSQYRSIIFYNSNEQKDIADQSRKELEKSEKFDKPIATEIIPASEFYEAEEYHQRYLEKHGMATCHI